jgi:hypothetical protein
LIDAASAASATAGDRVCDGPAATVVAGGELLVRVAA